MNGKENAECSSASAQRASQTRESIKEEKDVRGIHLMLAEDNELNAEIVKAPSPYYVDDLYPPM